VRFLKLGPKRVIVKKGEHGAMLVGPEGTFLAPAMPLDRVVDPTGAGDTFAAGSLAIWPGEASQPGESQASHRGGKPDRLLYRAGTGRQGRGGLDPGEGSQRAKEFYRFASLPSHKL